MKKILIIISLAFTWQNVLAQTKSIEILKKLNRDWLNSITKKDTATLSKILADDFILIAQNGRKLAKRDNLSNILSPNIEYTSVNVDSLEVRLLSSVTGILTCWTTFIFNADGKESAGKNCYQDVYMKRNGRWQAVSAHVTLLSMK